MFSFARPRFAAHFSHGVSSSKARSLKSNTPELRLTLRGLGAYIFLDQGICRLSVKAESVFERLHVGALLEEGFLQPVSTRMEILLWMNGEKTKRSPHSSRTDSHYEGISILQG